MGNFLFDNTYHIQDSSATALAWPSRLVAKTLVIYALNTNAAATFLVAVGTPIFQFAIVGSQGSAIPATYSYPLDSVVFPTAWIPTTLTACTAWIHLG